LKADPQMRTRINDEYRMLSERVIRRAAARQMELDLMVWPETMFRTPLVGYDENARMPDDWQGSEAEFRSVLEDVAAASRKEMARMARQLDVPLILGVDRQHFGSDAVRHFNSAVLVSRSGELLGTYDKMHLVLFGEYVPFAQRFRWLQRLTPLPISLTAGAGPAAFDIGPLRVAPNICYEDVLPHVIRRQVNELARAGREPDVLINLTNDGWFWGSSELDMHLVCGVFRAVECRKPLLIAANTGFSAWIDADGQILRQGKRRASDTILACVRVDRRGSLYLKHGDLPAGICLAACAVFACVGCGVRIRQSQGRKTGPPRASSALGGQRPPPTLRG